MSKGKSKRMTNKDIDEQFEAFLKDSVSSEESLDSSRINKFLEKPKREGKPWWLGDEDDDDDVKVGTGKSFLKKKPSDSQADKPEQMFFKEKDEKPGKADRQKNKQQGKSRPKPDVSISRDSLEDISEKSEEDFADRPKVHVPGLNLDKSTKDSQDISLSMTGLPQKLGMDTLDELADKEKFFKDLERNARGTIDYNRLNQELSVTGTTMSPDGAAKTAATLAALKDVEDDEFDEYERPGAPEPPPLSEARSHSEQKPSMLSKVSLMDSLESTMNTTTSPQVGRDTLQGAKSLGVTMEENGDEVDAPFVQSAPETFKTGSGFIGTNTSQEIEAFHKALREVGMSTTLRNESLLELSQDKGTADLVQKLLSGEIGNKTGKQRSVDEILKELEVLHKKTREEERKQADVDLPSQRRSSPRSPRIERQAPVALPEELRGFALSPVQQDTPGWGFDHSQTEDTEMYQPVTQVSVTEKSKGKKNTVRDEKWQKEKTQKSEKSKDAKGQRSRSPRSRDSKLQRSLSPRSRSASPRKPDIQPINETMKNKYGSIKSSGYGVTSPPKVVREGQVTKQKSLKSTKRRSASKSPRHMHDPKRSPRRVTSETDVNMDEEEAVKDGEDTDAQAVSELEKEKVKKADDTAKPVKTARKPIEKTGKTWSPAEITRQKVQGTHSPKQKRKEGVIILDSQLQASVDSFARYIKNHFTGDDVPQMKYSVEEPSLSASWKHKNVDLDLVRDWQERWKQENQAKVQLEAELVMAHREFEKKLEAMRLDFDQEIFKLKQDNFVLNAKVKVSEQDSVKKKVLNGETLEGVNKDQMALLEKELKEQETLLAGYQQENKRLYDEMKNIKKQSKQTEERMFKENQKLLSEMASLRTESEKKAEGLRDKEVITGLDAQQKIAVGDARFAGVDLVVKLEAELRETKISMNNLKREMNILVQSKVELEKHIEKLVTEREELKKKVEEAKTMKSEEARDLEKKYEEEIVKLKKKLQWYVENQELLDEGAKNLRLKGDEVHRLKMRIEELQTETGKRVEESKIRARERAADAKKIQDLQRQVKEMEQILRKRNPNALPTLIMAAAAASEPDIASKTPYVEVLEKRVKKLETELDAKDGEADKLLRGVEQKYNSIKFQYEERIKELELQLSIYQGQAEHTHLHTHAIALERELENVRERYKKQVAELQAEVDRLNTDVTKSRKNIETTLKSELQEAKKTESELHAHIKSLQVEVESKQHDLEVMQKSLERLRKEKHLYMMNGVTNEERSRTLKGRGRSKKEEIPHNSEFHSLPPERPKGSGKEYEPSTFAEAHISDILQENEELRTKVDQLQLQLDQQRVELRKSMAETEAVIRMSREEYEEQIQSLRASHQKELQRILADHALEQASSRTAGLKSKADTQEVMIKHLKEQLAKAEVEAEQVAILRIRQATLEMQLKKCEEELREAKKCHTPEMRHFEALQGKITQIEKKHEHREQELQQIIKNAQHTATVDLDREVEKWKKIVEMKNNEIQKFRMELDSILEVLRVLQKQGVIIPIGPGVS